MNKEFHWMTNAAANQVSDNYYRPDLKKAALANVMRHKIIPGIEIYAQPSIAANNAFGNIRYYNAMVLRSPIMIESSPAVMVESSPILRKMNYRFYSNNSNDLNKSDSIYYNSTNRPLSPHLPVYKPQLSSMFSIFNRISGAFLSSMVLSFYLLFKMGFICFTYDNFYQIFFLSEKFILVPVGLTASLAIAYHVFASLAHHRIMKFLVK
uniref:Succinate dehydrogenase subunit 3 n=1 Tax=Rhizophora mucronata TaxID=61149 RepID=A0A2P2JEB6_RHIMU